jgi:hypothetical protein
MTSDQLALPYGLRIIRITPYIYSGWNRRRRDNGRLEHISGPRLVIHRILWGFNRLIYIEPPRTSCLEWTGLIRSGFSGLGGD